MNRLQGGFVHWTLTHNAIELSIDVCGGTYNILQLYELPGKQVWSALVKIQRWLRRIYSRPKLIAVAMCLHKRLGAAAGVGCIGMDNVELVMRSL